MKNIIRLILGKYYFKAQKVYSFIFFNFRDGIKGLLVDKDREFKIAHLQFKFPKSDLWEYGRGFVTHELAERELVERHITSEEVILELGGSVGVVSCFINRKLSAKQNHIVVEPNPRILEYLKANRDLNNCEFLIEECIVSRSHGKISMNIYKNYKSSSVEENTRLDGQKIEVKTQTLQDLEKKHQLKFDTVVMDIEGHEIDFIESTDLGGFKKLIIEFHPRITPHSTIAKCKETLTKNGFKSIDKISDVEVWCRRV
ncbi:FkbM family methyltransferase [Akkermansiaceae bacterium]|nr:FkbM family methyltransferase [Akkermansiaceae bacterium]